MKRSFAVFTVLVFLAVAACSPVEKDSEVNFPDIPNKVSDNPPVPCTQQACANYCGPKGQQGTCINGNCVCF
ncbi:unnamed protein product [Callosobruchus maculatus]|uniref:Invertebrate defensins family profile domain-containing protein n=1 Tax=Callosobruchus maculatus TaxID=64391 RepID=A0A653DGF6_CALMS|nr:unnamed protein product [Callosobruchus maculatus]